jgi:hemolysin activation/secretion protein
MNVKTKQRFLSRARLFWLRVVLPVLLLLCHWQIVNLLDAAETNVVGHFHVQTYVIGGNLPLTTNIAWPVLAQHTGTNVDLSEIVQAATDLQALYQSNGFPNASVAFAPEQITNGVVKLNVFQAAVPQIVVSGRRYFAFTNNMETVVAKSPIASNPSAPASPRQTTKTPAASSQKMSEANNQTKNAPAQETSTNPGPRFAVQHYFVMGNSVLSPQTIAGALTNVEGAFGTNVTLDGIRAAVAQLQSAYRERGYATVVVGLPQQKLTNATVKMQVTEGWLAAIEVKGNRYFSSNNVMRSLPSLRTNILINAPVLQAELNRANANQDRQIYPVIGPGPFPGTSELTLKVKDRLPLHGKVELNNQNSPGTPDLRINTSAVEDNLWQQNHSFGVQYGFSPEEYKTGNSWNLYDLPMVAYYSAFYRLPLGNPEAIESTVANNPDNFGYNEATHQFRLPPPSGQTELNLYASRAAIDTGVETLSSATLFNAPFVRELDQQEVQQGITINETLGFQLSKPLPEANSFRSTLSGGLDYKIYSQENYQTNIFIFHEFTKGANQQLIERTSYDYIPTPATQQKLDYLPLAITYNANMNDFVGPATLGLGLSANLLYSSSTLTNGAVELSGKKSLQGITGSAESSGYWVILRPSFSQDFTIYTNWVTTFHADGQWASEPLISNEQFGIGGVNSVRGYLEGETFGDNGWHLSLEQQTPPYLVGMVHGDQPLTVRGSIYMDWATAYLIDPQSRAGSVELWSTGFGVAASVGSYWQARLLFSLPLISSSLTPRDEPVFNFSLTAQF